MALDMKMLFRKLPAVDRLLADPAMEDVRSAYPRSLVLKAIHLVLEDLRGLIKRGEITDDSALGLAPTSALVRERVALLFRPSLRPGIDHFAANWIAAPYSAGRLSVRPLGQAGPSHQHRR